MTRRTRQRSSECSKGGIDGRRRARPAPADRQFGSRLQPGAGTVSYELLEPGKLTGTAAVRYDFTPVTAVPEPADGFLRDPERVNWIDGQPMSRWEVTR